MKLPWAAKFAERVWLPAPRTPRLRGAEPLVSDIVEAAPPSTLSVAFPETVPPEELTETVALAAFPKVTLGALMEIVVGLKILMITWSVTVIFSEAKISGKEDASVT